MEERYPGLEQALNFVSFLNIELEGEDMYKHLPSLLREYNARGLRQVVTGFLEERLPLADTATKFFLLGVFNRLNSAVDLMEEASEHNRKVAAMKKSGDDELDHESILQNATGKAALARSIFDEERTTLRKFELRLSNRLKKWHERLPNFRAEIEAYFDR